MTTTRSGPTTGSEGSAFGPSPATAPVGGRRRATLAVWLFIFGDAVFVLLEVFSWLYLRALNTNGLWRGVDCSRAHPCVDGQGHPILGEIPTANPTKTVAVAVLVVVGAALLWAAERRSLGNRPRAVTVTTGMALGAVLLACLLQVDQFRGLPFSRVQGSYASLFFFVMASNLFHLALAAFVCLGVWMGSRRGHYVGGHAVDVQLVRSVVTWIAASVCILAAVTTLFT
jgi:heme/copper-type cytochrome/quinol oxidase subunit 3